MQVSPNPALYAQGQFAIEPQSAHNPTLCRVAENAASMGWT